MGDNSVLLLDNFDAHETAESREYLSSALNSEICMLPPNCPHVCQPLDVGVMGPFKAILRTKWLANSIDQVMDDQGALRDTSFVQKAADKRLATIERAIAAWNAISEKTIRKSFKKALPRPSDLTITSEVSV